MTANTFTRDGYTFAGWKISVDGEKIYEDCARVIKLATTANAEVTLYAQWKTVTYTITYNLNGGINAENNPADYNTETDTITLSDATPQKEGYTFGGWYIDDTFDETKKIVQIAKGTLGDIALYAKWNANTYTVKFDANGGSGSMDSQTFTYDVEQTLTAIGFARKDYTFAGWAKSTDGEIIYSNKGSVKNLTAEIDGEVILYAIWNEAGLVYVQGATITGAITGSGYTTSSIFIADKTVTVGDFYMCDHEVTQAEYETYCEYGGTEPSEAKGDGDNYPAYNVSWYDVLVYCNKRSMAENLTPCYTISGSTDPNDWGTVPTSNNSTWHAVTCNFEANGYRLPKEAEWEYAARGGNGLSDYQYKYAGSDTIGDVAWYTNNSNSKTHEVKGKVANGLGLYDMSGNVYEWCWDSDASGNRYARGGSWSNSADHCTVSYRYNYYAYYRGINDGFRVVRTAE